MKLVTRYLNKYIFSSLGIILLIIWGLDFIFGIFEEVGKLTNNFQLPQLAYYNLLSLFDTTVVFLPFIALLTGVIGLARIKANNELTIIQASGYSKWRIINSISLGIFLFVGLIFIAAEFWQIQLEDYLKSYKYEKKSGAELNLYSKEDTDIWLNINENLIRIKTARSDGYLYGITKFEFDENKDLKQITAAKTAKKIDAQTWRLMQVHQIKFVPIDANSTALKIDDRLNRKVVTTDSDNLDIYLPIETKYLIYRQIKPRKLNLKTLYGYAKYLDLKSDNSTLYWTLFWRKLFMPVSVFFLIALGASFIFETSRTKPMGLAIFKVLLLGILFLMLQDILPPMATNLNISTFLVSAIPVIIIAIWAILRLRRI